MRRLNAERNIDFSTIVGVLLLVVLVLSLSYNGIRNLWASRQLHQHAVFSTGLITAVREQYKTNDAGYDYEYIAGGKLWFGTCRESGLPFKNSSHFLNQHFTAVYDSTNYLNSRLLIFPEDYASFQLPFPDSLQWTFQYKK